MSGAHHQGKPRSGEYALLLSEALRSVSAGPRIFTPCTGASFPADVEYVRERMREAEGLYLSDRCPGCELVIEEGKGKGRLFVTPSPEALDELRFARPVVPSGRRLVMAAFSCDDPIVGPTFASVALSGVWVQRIRELATLCYRHRLKSIRAEGTVMQWGPGSIGQTLRLYDRTVVVEEREVWFEDQIYRTDVQVQTTACGVDALEKWWYDGDGDLFVGDDLDDLREQYEEAMAEVA